MAIISFPAEGLRDMRLVAPFITDSTRSIVTGHTKVAPRSGGRWTARLEVAVRTPAQMLDWKRFLMALEGRVNSFLLPAIKPDEQAAVTPATVTVHAINAGGNSLTTAGWGRSGVEQVMEAGQTISLNGRAHILTAAASTISGTPDRAVLAISPRVHVLPTVGQTVQVRSPIIEMRLSKDDSAGWLDALVNYQPLSLDVEEAH